MTDSDYKLAGIPAELLGRQIVLDIDEDGARNVCETAESFFRRCDPDVIDYPGIAAALLAGETYRDGGGAAVEWSIRLAEAGPVQS